MYKILIVDDDRSILENCVNYLHNSQFKTMVASNGDLGFKISVEKIPDLILMDWNMPILDGIETIELLKTNNSTIDIPIIMMTAQSDIEHIKKSFDKGVIDYIKKPIDYNELVIRVKSALKLISSYREISKLKIEQLEMEKELQRLKNVDLSNKITAKSNELYLNGLHISQMNDVLSRTISRFQKLKKEAKESVAKEIDEIQDEVEHLLSTKNDYEYFKNELNQLNYELIHKLNDKCPDLTDNELKICSMVHLGLSNKDISSLLAISTRTVENTRYRITKKLGLDSRRLKEFLQELF
jgi:DNA-binding response OmpR family regulator/DNA-binding CsgD family transcriptional regulator